jgi:PAS domain S-box-containing protein
MRKPIPRPIKRRRVSKVARQKASPTTQADLKRAIHELEVYQEEIRIQNHQLIESQRLLEESHNRYANLYDLAPVPYVTLCPNGVIREINSSAAKLLAVARARALESPLILFLEPASRRAFLNHLQCCREDKSPCTTELTFVSRQARRIDAELSSGAGFEIAPGEWRYPTTFFDLTERKRAEEERRRLLAVSSSERLLRAVLSVLPVGVQVIDASGNIQLQNEASHQIFGELNRLPLDRWEELGLINHATGQNLPHHRYPMVRAFSEGETILREEVELQTGGGRRVLQLSAVPLRDQAGAAVGAVGVSEDVTELKLAAASLRDAKESAESANRVKDNFLAVVSHELRTPLTAILLWSRLLRQGTLDKPTTVQAVESIEQSVQSQLKLVDDLLDVSRIVAGKLRLVLKPTPLRDVVEAALASVRPDAKLKGVELIEDLGRTDCVARIDPDRMRQVIANLLANALKFTSEGGQVQISVRSVERNFRVEVTDNGRGIPPEFLPHVFERFRQADSATTRVSGGLGLGLSIARQLVELHGGTIAAKSPGEGLGATFIVELPRHRPTLKTAGAGSNGKSRH